MTNAFSSSDSMQNSIVQVKRPIFDYDNPDAFKYYQYGRLRPGYIRLIHLVTGDIETWGEYEFKVNDLELQIIDVRLDEAPPFDALSYCWGPTSMQAAEEARAQIFTPVERCYPMRCNGGFVRVTKSLREALWAIYRHSQPDAQHVWRSARGVSRSVWLWADGVCLNQDDDRDKAQGIAMMSEIYLRASTVIIWLGQQDDSTTPAFRVWVALQNIAATRKFGQLEIGNFYDDALFEEAGSRRPTKLEWCHWAMFYTRTWWYRSWVIQEAGLAGKNNNIVLCGLQNLALQDFSIAARVMEQGHWACEVLHILSQHKQQFPLIADDSCRYNALVGHAMSGGRWPWQYVELLWRVRSDSVRLKMHQLFEAYLCHTQCKDPRDKVHAMRGLADEFRDVRPKDLSTNPNVAPEKLFCQATRLILRKNRSLRILFSSMDTFVDGQRNGFRLPSWCPNYNASPIRRGFLSQDDSIGRTKATASSVYIPEESNDWVRLILRGCRIDVVRAISLPDPPRMHGFFKSWSVASSIFKVVAYLVEARFAVKAIGNLPQEFTSLFLNKRNICYAKDNPINNLWSIMRRGMGTYKDDTVMPHYDKIHAYRLSKFVTRELLFAVESQGREHHGNDAWSSRGHHSRHGYIPHGPSTTRFDDESFTSLIGSIRQIERNCRLDGDAEIHLPDMEYLEQEVNWSRAYTDDPLARSYYEVLRLSARHSHSLNDETVHARVDSLVTHSLRGRVVYGTDGLNIGIGPDDMQIEDEVWLLAGGSVPYILRRLPNGNYHFLGESYMEGVMQGEAWPADPSTLVRVVLE